jgi:hypothetical protein
MIEHELAEGDPRAAARLITELSDAPSELNERVSRAIDAENADREELVRLRRDLDPRIGHRARLAMTAALGIFWTLGPSVAELTGMGYARDAASLAAPPAIVLAIVLVLVYVLRRIVFASALNRLLVGAVIVSAVAEVSIHTGGALAGLTPAQTLAGALLLFAVAIALVAIAVARTLLIAAVAYVCGFYLISLFPEARAWIHSGVNLVFTLTLLHTWRTRVRSSLPPPG